MKKDGSPTFRSLSERFQLNIAPISCVFQYRRDLVEIGLCLPAADKNILLDLPSNCVRR